MLTEGTSHQTQLLVASVRKGLLSNLGNVKGFVNKNGMSNLAVAFGLLGRIHHILLAVRIGHRVPCSY